jgi:hypothetical protein
LPWDWGARRDAAPQGQRLPASSGSQGAKRGHDKRLAELARAACAGDRLSWHLQSPLGLSSDSAVAYWHFTGKRAIKQHRQARGPSLDRPAIAPVVREPWTCTYADRPQRSSWHTCLAPSAKRQNREAVPSLQRQSSLRACYAEACALRAASTRRARRIPYRSRSGDSN